MNNASADITMLLRASACGSPEETERLMVAIYDDLKRLAASQLRNERGDHTLQPTALVNEAYIRLINQHNSDWNNRQHFFSIAARIIRRILIDYARERQALKRGGTKQPIRMESLDLAAPLRCQELIELDEAMLELAQLNERQAQIVELRYFGGLTMDEIAQLMKIGKRTVDRDWNVARIWLYHRLSDSQTEHADEDRK